jgi:molybdenum cofactor biosynthesis enzyme MoaA
VIWSNLKKSLQSYQEPIPTAAIAANKRVWENLPESLKHARQVLGVQSAGCSATVGLMEKCDFYCTACYLPASSNDTPPLSFEEVKEQLDQIAAHLGPTGNIQLTAGEVTLLPREELGRIIEYCGKVKLTPMLMTNGQTILRDPSYLDYLLDKGLTKVAFHIDNTQRGRDGQDVKDTEVQLHWIRDAFANLIRATRQRTGVPFHAAQTFTVTRENQPEVPEVMKWMIKNSDAFRMISFQPTAEVGRTRVDRQGGDVKELWEYVSDGVGKKLSREGMNFGHQDCNTVSMSFIVKWAGKTRYVEFLEKEKDWRFFHKLLRKGFGSFTPFDESPLELAIKVLALLSRHPNWLWDLPNYILYRMHTENSWLGDFVRTVLSGGDFEINPFAVVVHNFMSSDELLTARGQERLAACSFKVPYNGRMVSMCEFNGEELREENNLAIMQTQETHEGVLV